MGPIPICPFVFQADGTFYYGYERGGRDSEGSEKGSPAGLGLSG